MSEPTLRKGLTVILASFALLALPGIYLLTEQTRSQGDDPVEVAKNYLTAIYARDYRRAYRWISKGDQRYKSAPEYLRENPSFSGTALELAYKLADDIDWRELSSDVHGDRATVRIRARLPDANAPALGKLLLDFDVDRLASLSGRGIQTIEEKLQAMRKQETLPMIEGEENVELVLEQGRWRVSVNWVGAIRVNFKAEVKEGLRWEFWPVQEMILAKPGETLQAVYKAKNLSNVPITAKALHLDEPRETAAKYLEIIQCFCFIQKTLAPGEEKEFPLVFRIDWNAPNDVREFKITYEFYPIDKFPEKRAKNPA